MRLLSSDYLSRRFDNKLPSSQVAALRVPGLPAAPTARSLDETRITAAADATESWFLRQIPVFAEVDPDQLPPDLKAALADICYDCLFGIEAKSNEDREQARRGEAMILSVAPSYAGARVADVTGEIIMDPDACLVDIAGGWN